MTENSMRNYVKKQIQAFALSKHTEQVMDELLVFL